MANYKARLNRDVDGSWVASAVELPNCWSRGRTREEAVNKLRDEIRYRIEYCPCSGVDDEYVRVELQVVQEPRHAAALPASDLPAPAETGPPPRETAGVVERAGWTGARPATPAPLSGVAGCPSPKPETTAPESTGPAPRAPESPPARGSRSPGWKRWDD